MTDEINEIIRVLQLTTYDEEEWDADNLTVMKKALNAIDGKAQAAHDWLQVSKLVISLLVNMIVLVVLNLENKHTWYLYDKWLFWGASTDIAYAII